MNDDQYRGTLEEHANDNKKKSKGVFKNFFGDNTDGTGSDTCKKACSTLGSE
ncbi:hypothetical protein DPSP01_011651 [Paraphaeosphaeria sporulosa]